MKLFMFVICIYSPANASLTDPAPFDNQYCGKLQIGMQLNKDYRIAYVHGDDKKSKTTILSNHLKLDTLTKENLFLCIKNP